MPYHILAINPGSTSTKVGIFRDETLEFEETIRHEALEIAEYNKIINQKDFRKTVILKILSEKNIDLTTLDAIVGRGGMLKPIPSGTYRVNDEIVHDLSIGLQGQHASNLGGIIAKEIGDSLNIPAFIVDPVVVDELMPVARVSGLPQIPKVSAFHALNQKAVAKRYAKETNQKYESLNLIIAHLGGGVTVGAHTGGKVVDVSNALEGEGTFSPERSGFVPTLQLIKMCYSGEYTYDEVCKKVMGKGGFLAHLGTTDMREVEKLIEDGDENAKLIYDAFIYQLCRNIGSMSVTLKGNIDQLIITGGIAYSKNVIAKIKEYTNFICDMTVYPGEDELLALVQGTLAVINGTEEAKIY